MGIDGITCMTERSSLDKEQQKFWSALSEPKLVTDWFDIVEEYGGDIDKIWKAVPATTHVMGIEIITEERFDHAKNETILRVKHHGKVYERRYKK